jgi:hypothetical protein
MENPLTSEVTKQVQLNYKDYLADPAKIKKFFYYYPNDRDELEEFTSITSTESLQI